MEAQIKYLLIEQSRSMYERGQWSGIDRKQNCTLITSYLIEDVQKYAREHGYISYYGERRDPDNW